MKKWIAVVLCLCMVASLAACTQQQPAPQTAQTAVERAQAWLEKQIKNNSLFSFAYDGNSYDTWEKTVDQAEDTWTVTYRSPEQVVFSYQATLDRDHASVSYVGSFANEGGQASPVISDILAINSLYESSDLSLTTAQGCTKSEYDFEPIFVDFSQEETYTMKTTGGRSSDGAFPYFDLSNGQNGLIGAIGWTGNWKATFTKTETGVQMQAGMQETRIALPAGEQMRTPSMTLMFYDGDADAGHNALRALLLNEYIPESMHTIPLTLNQSGGSGEDDVLSAMVLADRLEHEWETLWVDAGWYGEAANADITANVWSTQVGNWFVNTDIWSSNFYKVNAALDAKDRDLLLWFEPERSVRNSRLATQHPEYFLTPTPTNQSGTLVYNFGDEKAVDHMVELVGDLLIKLDVEWYRQDCNFAPAETWIYNDSQLGDNMVGYTEIRYITGLYRYLDQLCEKVEGLRIDNCAAGGRRLDIEMMSRSVPLWRTDYTSNTKGTIADGVRNINYGLSWWIPLHCGGRAADGMNNSYQWRAMIAAGVTVGPLGTGTNDNWFKRMLDEYMEIRDLFDDEYYILSAGYGKQHYKTQNAVYEYFNPEEGRGVLIAFCPQESQTLTETCTWKGLNPDKTYTLTAVDTGDTAEFTGKQLMEQGLELRFAESYESLLIHINEK